MRWPWQKKSKVDRNLVVGQYAALALAASYIKNRKEAEALLALEVIRRLKKSKIKARPIRVDELKLRKSVERLKKSRRGRRLQKKLWHYVYG